MLNKSGVSGRHKQKAAVRLSLAGQEPFEAIVFLTLNARLIDLLNDERAFIPVKKTNGETIIVAKTQIISIIETESPKQAEDDNQQDEPGPTGEEAGSAGDPKEKKAFDPYAALRIERDATLEEIRAAYKMRIKAVHPDSLSGLDLDEDLERAALQATQRVNYAYKKILAEREDILRGGSHEDEDEDAA